MLPFHQGTETGQRNPGEIGLVLYAGQRMAYRWLNNTVFGR